MANNLKALGLLIGAVGISLLLAAPVIRNYPMYTEYGGAEAFLAGYLLCFYFLSGMLYGLFRIWYKTLLLLVCILSLAFFIWFVAGGDTRGWHFLILGAAGYLIGFAIRKVVERFRQPAA